MHVANNTASSRADFGGMKILGYSNQAEAGIKLTIINSVFANNNVRVSNQPYPSGCHRVVKAEAQCWHCVVLQA